jgi:hypothetical protein
MRGAGQMLHQLDVPFEFRPTRKPVVAGQNQLSARQLESHSRFVPGGKLLDTRVVLAHHLDGAGIATSNQITKLFCPVLELVEIRVGR